MPEPNGLPGKGTSATRRDWVLLVAALLSALFLVWSHAFARPLFQVSDELNYLHTVQSKTLEYSLPTDRACLAPPDGRTLNFPPLGGKFGFHLLAGRVLLAACRAGSGTLAIPMTRAVLGLTLPVLVALTWAMGRILAPHEPFVASAAAILTACQPVLATFSGGIAPDGLANAASAGALVVAAHLILNRANVAWLLVMTACSLLAVAAKDSALFLAPLTFIIAAARLVDVQWRVVALVVATMFAVLLLLSFSGLLPHLSTPFPNFGRVLGEAASRPATFLAVVVQAYASNAKVIASSGLAGLANFGGGMMELPRSLFAAHLALIAVGLAGFVAATATARDDHGRLVRFAALVGAATLLEAVQIPVRQMMTDSAGPIQGRWLFPVWPLLTVACMSGWNRLLGGRSLAALPLLALLCAVTASTALIRLVEYYYDSWPASYDWSNVFLLAVEGSDAGVPIARAMAAAVVVPGWLRTGVLVAATGSLLCMFLVSVAIAGTPRRRVPPCPTR